MKNLKVEKERSLPTALVLTQYFNKDQSPGRKELVIKSPYMKAALKALVPAYKNSQIHLKHLLIVGEPRCLFHYRDEFRKYCANLEDQTAVKHVLFLMKYMCWELAAQISLYRDNMIVDRGTESLDHRYLWMAFRPGDLIYASAKSHEDERIYRFISMEYKGGVISTFELIWSIKARCIVSDGDKFREYEVELMIDQFNGIRRLHTLPIFPLKYHPEATRIHAQLLERGKKFCRLYSSHYRQYKGIAELLDDNKSLIVSEDEDFYSAKSTTVRSTMVNGRIIIDPKAFSQARPAEKMYIPARNKFFNPEKGDHLRMSNDEYTICNSQVTGYSLGNKKWGYFRVDLIDEVVFNEMAFDSLILDTQLKQQIQSLVQIHSHEELKFDDVIRGKGKGIVFLLHGEPGVGKTLTAESVADNTRRPLLRLDASSLGTTAESVEKGLMAALRFSEKWKAVALLDEADVFLTQRKATDLEHNSIVSVFLRVLEYYEGILFLTTNRVSHFDSAIKSRIHLAIHYPKLSRTSRQSLWHLFLSRSSAESVESLKADGTLDRIADEELNGRQIKNVVRLAYSLALSIDIDELKEQNDMPVQFHIGMDNGAKVNQQSGECGTALQTACLHEESASILLLLENGADVNARGGKDGTALMVACKRRNAGLVRLLLDRGADINAQTEKHGTALMVACKVEYYGRQSMEVVQLLLDRGADVNAQGGKYGTALAAACRSYNSELVQLLLAHGADAHLQDCAAWHSAAYYAASSYPKDNADVLHLLLVQGGIDVNHMHEEYSTALHTMMSVDHAYILGDESFMQRWRDGVDVLFKHSIDANIMSERLGSALHVACAIKHDNMHEYIKHRRQGFADANFKSAKTECLLEQCPGINVNAQGGAFGSALQAAAYSGQTLSVRLLLDRNADVNARSGKYRSALNGAVISGYWDIVEILLEAGAMPDCHLQEQPDEEWLQRACRITLFSRDTCGLCTQAKGVLSDVWDKRPFQYIEVDLAKPEFKHWKNLYDFDIPVIHISKSDTPEEDINRVGKAIKLMHRFTTEEVEAKMDQVEGI
ncbi:hypothetical protein TrVFT333_000804 [Trichoderma virens FT-333]|nr:hypothetical protein TrVFT333_000804 [Trichoderma virens FT-333]